MELRPFTFNNSAILPRVDYGAVVKLEITYSSEAPWTYLTLTSIRAPNFDFALKKFIAMDSLLLEKVVFAIVDLLGKQ